MLLGNARPAATGRCCSSERFERRGAYVVPAGAVDWDSLGPSYVPQGGRAAIPTPGIPRTRSSSRCATTDGHLLGIVSVDEPVSGRRPTDDELDVLVALADHAALAVEAAHEAAEAARHQLALEQLLAVSSRITGETVERRDPAPGLRGVRDALDFQNVCAALVDPETGALVPHATAGWQLEEHAPARARDPRRGRAAARRDVPAARAATSSPHDEARARLRSERRRLSVAAQRQRAAGVEPALAARSAAGRPGRAARDHLGGRPVGPAPAVGRPAPGAADLREPGRGRARLGPASRRAALPRRPRSAHAPAQPARLRRPPRRRGRAGGRYSRCSASWSRTSTASSS